jgi:uncharacterized protein (TIGR02246 family)
MCGALAATTRGINKARWPKQTSEEHLYKFDHLQNPEITMNNDSDEQAIRHLIERWHTATREGDVNAVLALMAPDVVFLVAGQPPMQGRDVFGQAMRTMLANHAVESTSEIDEIEVVGDMAYCRTRLSVTMISKHGETPMQRTGHSLSILRKGANGEWLLTRDANMLGVGA